MGWAQRLRERIDPPTAGDPDDWVVVAVVPFAEGPLVHSALTGAGIEAVMDWRRAFAGRGPDLYRISVRRRDQGAAEEIVRDARGHGCGSDPSAWR